MKEQVTACRSDSGRRCLDWKHLYHFRLITFHSGADADIIECKGDSDAIRYEARVGLDTFVQSTRVVPRPYSFVPFLETELFYVFKKSIENKESIKRRYLAR